jgi:hypothetical protein
MVGDEAVPRGGPSVVPVVPLSKLRGVPEELTTVELGPGREYSPAEAEFVAAMDRYKREHRRPFPAWAEVLEVVRALGYARGLSR